MKNNSLKSETLSINKRGKKGLIENKFYPCNHQNKDESVTCIKPETNTPVSSSRTFRDFLFSVTWVPTRKFVNKLFSSFNKSKISSP